MVRCPTIVMVPYLIQLPIAIVLCRHSWNTRQRLLLSRRSPTTMNSATAEFPTSRSLHRSKACNMFLSQHTSLTRTPDFILRFLSYKITMLIRCNYHHPISSGRNTMQCQDHTQSIQCTHISKGLRHTNKGDGGHLRIMVIILPSYPRILLCLPPYRGQSTLYGDQVICVAPSPLL